MEHSSFWRVCQGDTCHCDWRITITDCVEHQPMYYLNVVNVVVCWITFLFGCGLLYHRVVVKKKPVLELNNPRGFLVRPKPIESLLIGIIIFAGFRAIGGILLFTDIYPNPTFRAWIFDVPFQFAICAFESYMLGIAQTAFDNSKMIENSWLNWFDQKADTISSTIMILPFITNNICTIAAGVFGQQGDLVKAKIFTDILYYCWTVYCFTVASLITYSGVRLLNMLNEVIRNSTQSNDTIIVARNQKLYTGAFKVRRTMILSAVCLFAFTIIKLMYAIFRYQITTHFALNMVFAVLWSYCSSATAFLLCVPILLNPKSMASLGLSSSDKESNVKETHRSKTSSVVSLTAVSIEKA